MKYIFVDESWEDYLYWQKTDKKMLQKINELIKDISRTPFSGKGKPEPLKYKYKGFWSRRIDHEHRLIVLTPQIAGHNLKNKLGLIKFGNHDTTKKKIYT